VYRQSINARRSLATFIGLVLLSVGGCSRGPAEQEVRVFNCMLSGPVAEILSRERYDRIKDGMTLDEVRAALEMGEGDAQFPEAKNLRADTEYRVTWSDGWQGGRMIAVILRGDRVIAKEQRGLE
jgi:hypothetical protein